jgi:hypothetical protein
MLARREKRALELLADVPGVPNCLPSVSSGGRLLENAVARHFIPGEPLRRGMSLSDQFFPSLLALLQAMHNRGLSYVDLHKRENILVGANGLPYLIDFQISISLPRFWPLSWIQSFLHKSDLYHFHKHVLRIRPNESPFSEKDLDRIRPWMLRIHRIVGVPLRQLRRRLLVRLGIRRGRGEARTELAPEQAFRAPAS